MALVAGPPVGKGPARPPQPEPLFGWDPALAQPGAAGLWTPLPYFRCFAFSPDGKYLAATRATQSEVYVWDVATGKRVATLTDGVAYTNGVAFSPDGKHLAALSSVYVGTGDAKRLDGGALIWDTTTWKLTATLGKKVRPSGVAVAFSPDSKQLATSGTEPAVWEVATEKLLGVDTGQTGAVRGIAFSPDGKLVAASNGRGAVRAWEAKTGKVIATLKEPGCPGETLAFSPDGKMVLTTGANAVCRWNLATEKADVTVFKTESDFFATAISPDQKTLATGGGDGAVLLWDIATGKQIATLTKHKYRVLAIAFSPDGNLVASGSQETGIKLDRVPERPEK
jgi:WD40 repeat protein